MFQPPQPHQLPPPQHHAGGVPMNSQAHFYPIVQSPLQPQPQPQPQPTRVMMPPQPQPQPQQQHPSYHPQLQPHQLQHQHQQQQQQPQYIIQQGNLYPQLRQQAHPQQPNTVVYGNANYMVAALPPHGMAPVDNMNQHILQQQQQEQEFQHQRLLKREEDASVLLFIIGFFCHWIWLIGHFKYGGSPSPRAQQFARYSRNAFIVSMILALVFGLGYLFLLFSFSSSRGHNHRYNNNNNNNNNNNRNHHNRNRQPGQPHGAIITNNGEEMIKSFIPRRMMTFDGSSSSSDSHKVDDAQFLKVFPEVKVNTERPVVVQYEGLAAEVKAMEALNQHQQQQQKKNI